MIYVYSTHDGRARCLSRDADAAPPLELVAAFEEEEAARAWALLHELGGKAPGRRYVEADR